jgi:hypothetical protein
LDNRDITRPPQLFTNAQGQNFANYTLDPSLLPLSQQPTTPQVGNFVQLAPGTDYTVDPTSGVITFKNPIPLNSLVGIDAVGANGIRLSSTGSSPGVLKMLKFDESALPQIPVTEDLTHYNVGATQIVRDNGQGNFTLQLRDLNNNPIGQSLSPPVTYLPNNVGDIIMNFQTGIFYLRQPLPYPSVYLNSPTSQSSFFIEFQAKVKTYTLRPNIVLNSEQITLGGRLLKRDVDYFIDYQSGFITFFNLDQIDQNTQIIATYDYSPFGIAGAQTDTLVGERLELSMYPLAPFLAQSLIGSTVLYDFAPTAVSAPDIRQTQGNYLVTEADIHFNNLVVPQVPWVKSSFTAEGARSARNPNTFGSAIIDSMNGIQQESTVNLSLLNWQVSATPSQPSTCSPTTPCGAFFSAMAGNLANEILPTLTINPNASALPSDQQQVLDINYDLTKSTEASIVTTLSTSGLDFSKKLFLEVYVQGDGSNGSSAGASGVQMDVTLGQVNEDADGTNGGGYVDASGVCHPFVDIRGGVTVSHPCGDGTPRTEDINYNNQLDVGEDIGWAYVNPDRSVTMVGAGNLHLDSEDLNRNGILDHGDPSVGGELGYANTTDPNMHFTVNTANGNSSSGSGQDTIDFSGWQFIKVPLDISSATAANWTAIQEMRISLRVGPGGVRTKGLIKIGKISVVGNTWQPDFIAANSTLTVNAIDNQDYPRFVSPAGNPDFDNLNQVNTTLTGPTPSKLKVTALALDYLLPAVAGSTVTAKSITTSAMDFTPYGSIRFFVYRYANTASGISPTDNGQVLFFRAGSDTDYLEFSVPTAQLAPNAWTEIFIQQFDTSGQQRPNDWRPDGRDPIGSTTSIVGAPTLASVSQLKYGVRNVTGQAVTCPENSNVSVPDACELWVDEIFAGDVITRIGYAGRLQSDFEIPGWTKFGLGIRDIDSNFQTYNSAINNQAIHEEKAYLNFVRLAYFPLNLEAHKTRTETPNVQQVTNTSLVSIQQQGRVDDRFYSANGTLQIPKWPKLGLLYDNDQTDTADLFRTNKTEHIGGTFDYSVPGTHVFLPKTLSLGYKRTNLTQDFSDGALAEALANGTDPFQVSPTKDVTNDFSAKLSFQPHPGFTFNPNFSRSTTRESKDAVSVSTDPVTGAITQTAVTPMEYDKSKSQTMGFDGITSFKKWFSPRLRYTVTNTETYGIPLSLDQSAANLKTVDRTDTGEVGWDLAWRDLTRRVRALQSLNVSSSYLMEDGDSWNNVPAGYNTLNFFSVRKPLNANSGDPSNPTQRSQLTLRETIRSTQRLSPFDWASNWSGLLLPLRTLSLTSTVTDTKQHTETTGTPSDVVTRIVPDLVMTLTQTEYFFHAQNFVSNSQMNIKSQYKTVDTAGTSMEKTLTNGGDWRFTIRKKLDVFLSYTRTTDTTFDEINNVVSNDSLSDTLSAQLGFNVDKWRITPKYDQSRQIANNAGGVATTDLTTRVPAVQFYADLFLPAGLRLPFSDLIVFSNRIRTTTTVSLTQKRSSVNELQNNTDTYALTTSEDYELTSNMRLTVGAGYSYQANRVSSQANFYSYQFNSLLTIQF